LGCFRCLLDRRGVWTGIAYLLSLFSFHNCLTNKKAVLLLLLFLLGFKNDDGSYHLGLLVCRFHSRGWKTAQKLTRHSVRSGLRKNFELSQWSIDIRGPRAHNTSLGVMVTGAWLNGWCVLRNIVSSHVATLCMLLTNASAGSAKWYCAYWYRGICTRA